MYLSGGYAKMMGQLSKDFTPIPPNASPVVENAVPVGISLGTGRVMMHLDECKIHSSLSLFKPDITHHYD
jgi:hypothetical protein